MAGDGVTLQGSGMRIFDNDGQGDTGVVEAPSLVKTPDNTYMLFFSNGCWNASSYDVNYATSSTLTGPYMRAANPLFVTGTDSLQAPGGANVWNDASHMVFHAGAGNDRSMYTATLTVTGSTVST